VKPENFTNRSIRLPSFNSSGKAGWPFRPRSQTETFMNFQKEFIENFVNSLSVHCLIFSFIVVSILLLTSGTRKLDLGSLSSFLTGEGDPKR